MMAAVLVTVIALLVGSRMPAEKIKATGRFAAA